MRKAKVAAIIFGGVSSCIFGGLFGVYATSPVVSSVAPKTNVENVYEVESEDLANVAAVTPIKTTTETTKGKKTTTTTKTASAVKSVESAVKTFSNTASAAAAAPVSVIEATTQAVTEAPTEEASAAPVQAAPAHISAPEESTEPAEEAYTEAYTEPATEAYTEAPTEAPTYYEEPVYVEPVTEAATEPEVVYVEAPAETVSSLPISDSDYIILCNAVAHEAGCYWIDEYDKAKVVEVIMNRVYSPLYPNTITGVLTQPYQFSGSSSYVYLGTYSGYVTESVKNAVNLYFNEPESFTHGYFSFYGDGYRNYFS